MSRYKKTSYLLSMKSSKSAISAGKQVLDIIGNNPQISPITQIREFQEKNLRDSA